MHPVIFNLASNISAIGRSDTPPNAISRGVKDGYYQKLLEAVGRHLVGDLHIVNEMIMKLEQPNCTVAH